MTAATSLRTASGSGAAPVRSANSRCEAPSRVGASAYGALCAKAADGMREADAFGEPEQWRFDWDRRYTRDEWLDQVPTSAFWAQIPVAGQREVLAGSGAAIDAAGGSFTVQYATVAVTATRARTA